MKFKHLVFSVTLSVSVLAVSLSANANNQLCKAAGEQAEKIMMDRQSNNDVFLVMEKHNSKLLQDMVIEAFEYERFDTLKQLSKAIKASGKRHKADELRSYDNLVAKQEAVINKFKMKYIRLCLSS
jgi:hypothetical protein